MGLTNQLVAKLTWFYQQKLGFYDEIPIIYLNIYIYINVYTRTYTHIYNIYIYTRANVDNYTYIWMNDRYRPHCEMMARKGLLFSQIYQSVATRLSPSKISKFFSEAEPCHRIGRHQALPHRPRPHQCGSLSVRCSGRSTTTLLWGWAGPRGVGREEGGWTPKSLLNNKEDDDFTSWNWWEKLLSDKSKYYGILG